ncbi:MAG: hypothetical protein Q9202_000146 [Teloschistes flavicans]
MSIFDHFTSKTPGSWIERKNIAITWHYRNATPDQGARHSTECKQRLVDEISHSLTHLEVINGKMCLEVRPRSVNKGTIVRRIVQGYEKSHGPGTSPDWVLCVGDDVTDEDMFKALRNSTLPAQQVFTVSVGPSSKETSASWYLPQPADVIALLDHLATPPKALHGEL